MLKNLSMIYFLVYIVHYELTQSFGHMFFDVVVTLCISHFPSSPNLTSALKMSGSEM